MNNETQVTENSTLNVEQHNPIPNNTQIDNNIHYNREPHKSRSRSPRINNIPHRSKSNSSYRHVPRDSISRAEKDMIPREKFSPKMSPRERSWRGDREFSGERRERIRDYRERGNSRDRRNRYRDSREDFFRQRGFRGEMERRDRGYRPRRNSSRSPKYYRKTSRENSAENAGKIYIIKL